MRLNTSKSASALASSRARFSTAGRSETLFFMIFCCTRCNFGIPSKRSRSTGFIIGWYLWMTGLISERSMPLEGSKRKLPSVFSRHRRRLFIRVLSSWGMPRNRFGEISAAVRIPAALKIFFRPGVTRGSVQVSMLQCSRNFFCCRSFALRSSTWRAARYSRYMLVFSLEHPQVVQLRIKTPRLRPRQSISGSINPTCSVRFRGWPSPFFSPAASPGNRKRAPTMTAMGRSVR